MNANKVLAVKKEQRRARLKSLLKILRKIRLTTMIKVYPTEKG